MTRPTKITAGNSYSWKESDTDYSAADGWTASAYITNQTKSINFAATSGDGFEFSLTTTLSKQLHQGTYKVFVFVEKDGERHTLREFETVVSPDPTAGSFDHRSYNEQVFDAIQALLKKSASKVQKSLVIDGQTLVNRSYEELLVLHDRFKRYVNNDRRVANNGSKIRRTTTRLP